MKIVSVEPIVLRIPFTDGSSGKGLFPSAWTHLDFVLVRIETDTGIVGWGESFGYFCSEAVAAMVDRAMVPLLLGRELVHPAVINDEIQRQSVLPGRYGITIFALSGVDLALWDIFAKSQGVSVASLCGTRVRKSIRTYASLVRYGNGDLVVHHALSALQQGYEDIKLHEITLAEIRRCRNEIGYDVSMTVDVNCAWSEAFARETIPELISLKTLWLEEPVFPPEDFRTLSLLQKEGLAIAAGENACTSVPFAEMIRLNAVEYLQPSITKVGGISEFQKIRAINTKLKFAPHSPYFGPGYLATLQMASVEEQFSLFEFLFVKPEAWLYRNMPLPEHGCIPIPEGPGLGYDPDPAVIERYRVKIARF
jgi:L-alanine-DL-glutamate epimerase-like enolase superfamily enzyme